jgi:F-type H+-transporting ATPase subunit b
LFKVSTGTESGVVYMEIHFSQILFQIVNFGLLLFLLTKLMYKPILKILDQRAEKIDEGLLAAQQNLEEKARIEEHKKSELKKAEVEAAKIMDEAKTEAKIAAKSIIDEARIEAQNAISKEESAFKARIADEEHYLSQRMSTYITLTTKSVLKDVLNEDHQREIINRQIKFLSKAQLN